MTFIIAVDDNLVQVNGGRVHTVDCSGLVGMHMVTWNGTSGEIEYSLVNGHKQPPTKFTDLSPFQAEIDAWNAAEAAAVAAAAPQPPNLLQYANMKQWRKATGGYTATINGQQTIFNTDALSMTLIAGKAARFGQPNPPASVQWQTGPGAFVTISAADFMTLAVEIADFVQGTFDALATVAAAVAAGTITTTAQIDSAF